MSIELLEGGLDEIGADSLQEWRRLAELRGNPFLTPEWYRACLEADSAGRQEPFLLVWRVDDRVRGVLPLVRTGAGGIRLLRFAGAELGDWFTPVCRREDEAEMAAACAGLLSAEKRRCGRPSQTGSPAPGRGARTTSRSFASGPTAMRATWPKRAATSAITCAGTGASWKESTVSSSR